MMITDNDYQAIPGAEAYPLEDEVKYIAPLTEEQLDDEMLEKLMAYRAAS
ncbi:MAG: hypothetical protein HRU20_12105 [Pseudomonadales bacterium]|nr:hypothetical protein [Pseudomonadales bacterium]